MESSTGCTIKGRDLPGAVKVVPEGLKEMISLRESHEFKMKETSSTSSSVFCGSKQESSSSSMSAFSSTKTASKTASSSMKQTSSVEDAKAFTQAMDAKSSGTYKAFSEEEFTHHGQQICQENLKSTLQSAISDLEFDLGRGGAGDGGGGSGGEGPTAFECNVGSSEDQSLPELAPLTLSKASENPLPPESVEDIYSSISTSLSRDPRSMFTDSSFYNPKHHPSVAEQVLSAHRLSCSLYEPGNRSSTGQDMFLKRARISESWVTAPDDELNGQSGQEITVPGHNPTPNLKLVMNPEGRVWEMADLQPDELPPMNPLSPEIAQSVIQHLQNATGRGGELFAKRRRKADDWIVDEGSLGKRGDPSQVAGNAMASAPSKAAPVGGMPSEETHVAAGREVLSGQEGISLQETFAEQSRMKADQSMEIRRAMEDSLSNTEMPILSTGTNNPYMQNMNWSIHNSQGIDVWTSPAPKSWTSFTQNAKAYNSQLVMDIVKNKGPMKKPEPAPIQPKKAEPPKQSQKVMMQASPSVNNEAHQKSLTQSSVSSSSMAASNVRQQTQGEMSAPKMDVRPPISSDGGFKNKQLAMDNGFVESSSKSMSGSSKFESSSKSMSSSSKFESSKQMVTSAPTFDDKSSDDVERAKREEYELWFRNQEAIQEKLEYDCLVKYSEEHLKNGMLKKAQEANQKSAQNQESLQNIQNFSQELSSFAESSNSSSALPPLSGSHGYSQNITDDQLNKIYKEVCLDKPTRMVEKGRQGGQQFSSLGSNQSSSKVQFESNQVSSSSMSSVKGALFDQKQPSMPELQLQQQPRFEPQQPMLDAQFDTQQPQFNTQQPLMDTPKQQQLFESQDPIHADIQQPLFEAQQPRYEPQQPLFEPQQPKFEPQQPRYEPQQPLFETQQPRYEPQQPQFESQQPRYEPQQPLFESQKPLFEVPLPSSYPEVPLRSSSSNQEESFGQQESKSLFTQQLAAAAREAAKEEESFIPPAPKMDIPKMSSPSEVERKRRSESNSRVRSSSKDRPNGKVDLFNGFDQAAEPCMDYEKRSVRNLVDRFSKTKPGSLPSQYLPQQYSKNFEPPLNYLKTSEPNKTDTASKPPKPKKKTQEDEAAAALAKEKEDARSAYLMLDKPRASVLDFLLMPEEGDAGCVKTAEAVVEGESSVEGSGGALEEASSSGILDPSALLGSEEGLATGLPRSKLMVDDSHLNEEISKWDNHNTIARGWKSASANYVPVTFRKKYHVVDSGNRASGSPAPVAST